MHNFLELQIWKKSMVLSKSIFILTKAFPDNEKYGLTSQINRASVSVPSNIAEGSSRRSDKDFGRFLQMSLGSLFELETQIILANEFEYISTNDFKTTIENIKEVQRMINGFIRKLNDN